MRSLQSASVICLDLRDPMQKPRTEQNERRTLQREFDIRSLEEGERTPQHLFDSLRKNSFEAKCACSLPLTPSSERVAQCVERGCQSTAEAANSVRRAG